MNSKLKENLYGFIFVLPSLILFSGFTFIPLFASAFLSFSKWNFVTGLQTIRWVGLSNYEYIFKDSWFKQSLINNLIYAAITVPLTIAIALLLAVVVNKFVYFKNFFKITLFMPYISSVVAVSIVWMVLFHPTMGPINAFLKSIGMENPPLWLADMKWALPTIMVTSIWGGLGYNMIIYIAALQGIPKDLFESAKIDGATERNIFWKIIIPMISPTTFFLFITGLIGSFKVFDQISVMTGGGPGNATSVVSFFIYKKAFEYYEMGTASAAAWVLFVVILVITIIQWQKQKKWVSYD